MPFALLRSLLVILTLLFTVVGPAQADSWDMPETESYISANGRYRLTVVPRQLDSQLAYFVKKSGDEPLPDKMGPVGRLEELRNGKWSLLWSRPMVNEVAPVTAVVADDGRYVATFDNWYSTGFGDHVVAIYGTDGSLVRSLRLDEIVPDYFVDALPRSVSSIRWRAAEPRFLGEMLEIAVREPRSGPDEGSFTVRIAMADGRVEPIEPGTLARLRPLMCAAHAERVRDFNEYLARERSNLTYPASTDKDDWQRYIHTAAERLRPRETGPGGVSEADTVKDVFGEAIFELLDAGAYMEKDFRDLFRDALTAPPSEQPRRWFAARDQKRLVAEVERAAKKIKPGQLAGASMHFFADRVHWPRIREALKTSGAQLVQIDPAEPIPPRADIVASLPSPRTIDPACATPVG